MRKFQRYISRDVAFAIIFVLFCFLALFSFFDMITEVKNVGRGGYLFQDALIFVLLRMPGRIYELMPIAVLIGSLYALSNLARYSEITVLRAAGLSTAKLLGVLLLVAAFFGVLTFGIGEVVTPFSERAAQQLQLRAQGKTIRHDLRSGLWVKDGKSFINVRRVLPDASLQDVRIYEFDDHAALTVVTEAATGTYSAPQGWVLSSVTTTRLSDGHSEVFHQEEMPWDTVLNPDILSVLLVSPERMSISHLSGYIKHLKDNNQDFQRYSIAFWKKLVYPFSVLVMVALALPFAYTHDRIGGVGVKIFSGVMIGVFFHLLNGLFSNLGAINRWPPILSALMPALLFFMVAMSAIWWVERR